MRTIFSIIIIFFAFKVCSQPFYVPYNILQAYEKRTRDYSGKPGANYFQNKAKYNITGYLDPKKGILNGEEDIRYYNNSPDTLYYMTIRFYHDILKKGNLRDEEAKEDFITKGVKVNSFMIEGEEYLNKDILYYNRSGTNLHFSLPGFLLPGDSIQLRIDWTTSLPNGHFHRYGNYGKSDWFVAYWYPQIAVYDDIDGWDMHNYTGLYEFYNDFNDFNVEINVPSGHLVWATGDFLNAEQVLSEKIYGRLQRSENSDSVVNIITEKDWKSSKIFNKSKKLVYKFSAKNITDFAFSVSDNYLWDATTCITDSAKMRKTVVHAVYKPTSKRFNKIAEAGAKAIRHFSYSSLGLPYPFPRVTVFNGDGGMEFPMMVNEDYSDDIKNKFVTMHELFHGYFPFMTGINECKYAWLDEGLTSYLPMETESAVWGNKYFQLEEVLQLYNEYSGNDFENPLGQISSQSRDYSYYHQAYYQSIAAFSVLEGYLGRELFRECIRQFVNRWKGKHPTSFDFLFTLSDISEQDLSWLINPWFFHYGWADLKIDTVNIRGNRVEVKIDNLGGMPVPIELNITTKDGDMMTKKIKADVWKDKEPFIYINIDTVPDLYKIELNTTLIPDKVKTNNYYYFK